MKLKLKIPHTFAFIFMLVIVCALVTYIVPSSEFERIKDPSSGKTVVDPESFSFVDNTPVNFFDIFTSIQKGMEESADIIFFVFIVGGSFGIITATGFIDAGLDKAIVKLKGREKILFLFILFVFSVGGATFGMSEEVIALIPVAVALTTRLGYDSILGVAITLIGAHIGNTTGMMNPFTVGIAQGIAELPMFSGLAYRCIWYVIIFIITAIYISCYADKIKRDPTKSPMYGVQIEGGEAETVNLTEYEPKHTRVLIVLILGLFALVYGVFRLGWYITEISGLFLLMGIASGFVGGLDLDGIAKGFLSGAKDMVFGALVIGFGRAILVVLTEGKIIDTFIYAGGSVLKGLPKVVAANGMFLFHLLFNFLIPSGSGQAAATMPIMIPLADMAGITRQTAVLAFCYGDGFTNLVAPTMGSLMACLAMGKVPLQKWVKWVMPLMLMWVVVGVISVSLSVIIGYGPF